MVAFFSHGSVGARVGALLRAAAAALTGRSGAQQRAPPGVPRLSREWLRRHEQEAAKHDAT
jgi:hypothetical protein